MMYNIYVGLTSLHYIGTTDCKDLDEALDDAYQMAIEEYETYAGYHGVPSWEELEQEIREQYADEIESGIYNDDDIESMTIDSWNESIESWVQYKVIPKSEDKEISSEDIFYL